MRHETQLVSWSPAGCRVLSLRASRLEGHRRPLHTDGLRLDQQPRGSGPSLFERDSRMCLQVLLSSPHARACSVLDHLQHLRDGGFRALAGCLICKGKTCLLT